MVLDKNILGAGILVSATIVVGAFLCSSGTEATSTSANATVNVAEACTMSSALTTPHTATIPPNTYQTDIGITTINVICNDSQGYAIYAVGYTGDEIGGANSTKLVGPSNTIDTGTATSGNTSNWAMKINTNGSSYVGTIDNSFGSYHAVPSEYTKVAHKDSGTDTGTGATGSTYQTTYAAFVSGAQFAGNYTGKVKYTMVHPANEEPPHEIACEAGKICYNPNTNIVEGEMGQQARTMGSNYSPLITNGSSVVLYASNFSRIGYGFAGWNTTYNYSGTNYGPNQSITAPNDIETNGLSLYAIWIKSTGDMQNWMGCSSLATGEVTALKDGRDNNVYAVAKLADGNCWTIENLRLDSTPELSSTNTNNPSLPLTNIYDATNPITSNHLSAPIDSTATAWCQTESSDCNDQSMLATNNTIFFSSNTSSNYSTSSDVYSYGNYYNWYSATAGYGKYDTRYGDNYYAPGDICPDGWHLPSGGSNSMAGYSALDIAMGGTGGFQTTAEASNRWRSYPNNFVYSGDWSGSGAAGRGSYYGIGEYWSRSNRINDYYDAYSLHIGDSVLNPGSTSSRKYDGNSVRCIIEDADN